MPFNKISKSHHKRRRKGFSLLEMGLALIIMGAGSAVLMNLWSAEQTRMNAKDVSDKTKIVAAAATRYLDANYSTILNSLAVGAQTQIPAGRSSISASIPANSLQGKGFLPASFVNKNRYDQANYLIIRKVDSKTLEALVTTGSGLDIPDDVLGMVVQNIGGAGGYTPSTYIKAADSGYVVGNGSGWRSQIANWGTLSMKPSSGTVQYNLSLNGTELTKGYLYRNDEGDPEKNRMNTAIDMNSNDINNIDKANANTVTATTVNGTTVNSTTVNGATVNATNANISRDLDVTRDLWAGRYLTVDGAARLNGTLTVAGKASLKGDLAVDGETSLGGDTSVDGALTVDGAVNANTVTASGSLKGNSLSITKNATIGNNLTVNAKLSAAKVDPDYLNANTIVYDDSSSGSTRFGADGKTKNGSKLRLRDYLPRMVAQYSYIVRNTNTDNANVVPMPTCRGGYDYARIMVYRQLDSNKVTPEIDLNLTKSNGYVTNVVVDASNSVVKVSDALYAVEDNSTHTWRVKWSGDPEVSGELRSAIAQTYCYYD